MIISHSERRERAEHFSISGAQLGLCAGPETGQTGLHVPPPWLGEGAGEGVQPGQPLSLPLLSPHQHSPLRLCPGLLLGPGQPLRQALRGEMLRRIWRHSGNAKADDQ